MARSVEAARGFYVRQRDQGFIDSIPTQSVGITQLKDEVRFGLMPVGTVFPVMVNIAGAYAPPSSGVVQDGFMRADGAAIPPGMALSGNVPDLTGSRFLMGTNGSGVGANPNAGASGGNANNMKTLSTPELPSHTHPAGTLSANAVNAPHGHPSVSVPAGNAPHAHPATVSVPSTGSDTPHRHGGGRAHGDIGDGNFGLVDSATYRGRVMVAGSPPDYPPWPAATTTMSNTSTPHSHPGASVSISTANAPHGHTGASAAAANAPHGHPALSGATGSQGAGDSFSILPQYVATVYLIRVK